MCMHFILHARLCWLSAMVILVQQILFRFALSYWLKYSVYIFVINKRYRYLCLHNQRNWSDIILHAQAILNLIKRSFLIGKNLKILWFKWWAIDKSTILHYWQSKVCWWSVTTGGKITVDEVKWLIEDRYIFFYRWIEINQ